MPLIAEICDDPNCEHCGSGADRRDNVVRSEELISKADLEALFKRADAQERARLRGKAARRASAKPTSGRTRPAPLPAKGKRHG